MHCGLDMVRKKGREMFILLQKHVLLVEVFTKISSKNEYKKLLTQQFGKELVHRNWSRFGND